MALNAGSPRRSGRFIRAYLITWGLLAAIALAYLASLAWPPTLAKPPARSQIAESEPTQTIRVVSKALAEIGLVRRSVTDLQKEVGDLKETVGERTADTKKLETRVTAIEERLSTYDANLAAAAAAQQQSQAAEKVAKAPVQKQSQEPRQPTRIISQAAPSTVPQAGPKGDGPPVPLETGSITTTATRKPSGFGTVVTRAEDAATTAYAVQLAAGPSLPALRRAWGELVERHGMALAPLHPRVVPPRNEGGPYRLLAGPLPTRSDADKVCAEMRVGRNGCFSTTYIGEPL
jgi:hypothetical protein